jgi:hypothetical protein
VASTIVVQASSHFQLGQAGETWLGKRKPFSAPLRSKWPGSLAPSASMCRITSPSAAVPDEPDLLGIAPPVRSIENEDARLLTTFGNQLFEGKVTQFQVFARCQRRERRGEGEGCSAAARYQNLADPGGLMPDRGAWPVRLRPTGRLQPNATADDGRSITAAAQ